MARLAQPEPVKTLEILDFEEFRSFLTSERFSSNPYSPATVDRYVRTARYFLDFAKEAGIRDLEEINVAWLRSYMNGKKPDGSDRFAQSTRVVQESALTGFWYWAQEEGYAQDNPVEQLARERLEGKQKMKGGRKPTRLPKVLSWEQQDELLALVLDNPRRETCARDYLMVSIFLAAGLRKEEMCTLRRDGFRPQDGTLRVVGKGNKERLVRFDPEDVLAAWEQYRPIREGQGDAPELLVTRTGKPLTGNLIYQQVSAYTQKLVADLPANGPHLLRHTSASRQLAMGVPITTVQANLGHENLQTLNIYAHLLPPRV